MVDDFGVKYNNKKDAEHPMSVFKEHCDIIEGWKGKRYIEMHMRWDYKVKQVHVAIPGYVEKTLKEFCHEQPRTQQDSPYIYTPTQYDAGAQVMEALGDFKDLDAAGTKFIQQVTGKLLYLGRAID